MTKYLLEIHQDQAEFTGNANTLSSEWEANCPVCQQPIDRYTVSTDWHNDELSTGWEVVAVRASPTHEISFEPCGCEIHIPPDELEVQVGPKHTGWEALAGLIVEAEMRVDEP